MSDGAASELTHTFHRFMWEQLGGDPELVELVDWAGSAIFPAPVGVTDLAAAAFASAGTAIAELVALTTPTPPRVRVDSELATAWLVSWGMPVGGWDRGTPWHDVSTDYPTADGRWLRLQANYPHLRKAILDTLAVPADRAAIARAVQAHAADEIEQAIVDNGGTVAASRTVRAWEAHPQGRAVAAEPLIESTPTSQSDDGWTPTPGRPLAGIRVLDLTRVLAGPIGTRFLAGYGAEVLRIDPTGYTEPRGITGGDLMLGKRCTYLDLDSPSGRQRFLDLLAGADVFVHGLRPSALDRIGLDSPTRREANPGIVEVTLNAYGWTGPWRERRGFDTLVQTSAGFSTEVMQRNALDTPRLLPAQVLDHATGYLIAAAAVRGLTVRARAGRGSEWRLALARTAALLRSGGPPAQADELVRPITSPTEDRVYTTPQGPVRRLKFPVHVCAAPLFWERPGDPYGSATATWATADHVGRR